MIMHSIRHVEMLPSGSSIHFRRNAEQSSNFVFPLLDDKAITVVDPHVVQFVEAFLPIGNLGSVSVWRRPGKLGIRMASRRFYHRYDQRLSSCRASVLFLLGLPVF